MATEKTKKQRTSLYFDQEFMEIVDAWRVAQHGKPGRKDIPSRNEAIIEMARKTAKRDGIVLEPKA